MARVGAAASWRRDITAMARPDIGTAVIITAACLIIIVIIRLITPAVGMAVTGTEGAVTGTGAAVTGTGAAVTGTGAAVTGGDRPRRLATQIRDDWRGALPEARWVVVSGSALQRGGRPVC
jgi:hypothetical protein